MLLIMGLTYSDKEHHCEQYNLRTTTGTIITTEISFDADDYGSDML